ncbi:MAG TPA: lactonase family protein [Terriglobia bacterium]|nr:lactonase family protein [Terriglobia bacterium]
MKLVSQMVTFVFVLGLLTASLTASAQTRRRAEPASHRYLMYVGTYTVRLSKGIYVYQFKGGRLTPTATPILAAETTNPSFLAIDPTRRYLYAVNETEDYQGHKTGGVSAFRIDRNSGTLTFLNEVPSGGTDPCYVALDHQGRHVLVANYTSGSVSVFPVLPDGRLGKATAFVQDHGHSVNPERQEGPHAHDISLSPDGRFVLVADLGLDQLLVYHYDAAHGTLTPNTPPLARVVPGSGPRHFVFDPSGKFVYLLSEVGSTITVFEYTAQAGTLHEIQSLSALPDGFKGHNDAAEIAIGRSGRFLYTSNRGDDSIMVFAVNPARHTLKVVAHVPTLGKTPRNFAIDPSGNYLLAANQDSDNIVVYKIDPKTGIPVPTGQVVEVSSPVCLTFTPVQ